MPDPASIPRRDFLQLCGVCAASGILAFHPRHLLAGLAPAHDEFIERLIARMTLEEKAGQLNLLPDSSRPDGEAFNPVALQQTQGDLLRAIAAGQVTGLFNGTGAAGARALQRVAVEESRLRIPLIFAADVIHGMRTIFPVPLAEAAAFDPDLAERTARAAAIEATASGIHWTFAPMVDLARDQRWGRVVEGSGEDPWLGSLLAAARVRGFQGTDLRREDSMLSTMKHFAAYGAVSGGMEYNSTEMSEATLRELHLPPFRAGVEAGSLSVMSSFNDISGVPSTANHHLLTDILRGEWGFKGLVVSDWMSEQELVAHGYAADDKEAARKALLAGCDVSMASGIYLKHLPALVREGAVPVAALDRAVRRVLLVKQALGLFENPYRSMDPEQEKSRIRLPATVALAREAARRSVVLLRNDGDLLPLSPAGQRIALIGPWGEDRTSLAGPWALFTDRTHEVSLAEGLRGALGEGSTLEVVQGSGVNAAVEGGIAAAVEAASRADVVLLALGEDVEMSGEAHSRVAIGIPAPQRELAEAVARSGKPIVVLLRHGRALALEGAVAQAPAILACWFLGSETGNALADLLFGVESPSGRLPVSFPQESGQEPYFYNHRSTGRPLHYDGEDYRARYIEATNEARYPFGHGLSYSAIGYGDTQLDRETLGWNGAVEVSATLTNLGARSVREVAQLYIHQRVSSLTRPVRALKGIQSVQLEPGQSVTVRFTIRRGDLASVQPSLRTAAEPGWYDVVVAPSSAAGQFAAFRLAAPRG